jgi:hypothetical protein
VLEPYVGTSFPGVVVDVGESHATIQLRDPAVRARCDGGSLSLGSEVTARLVTADPAGRRVEFTVAPPDGPAAGHGEPPTSR